MHVDIHMEQKYGFDKVMAGRTYVFIFLFDRCGGEKMSDTKFLPGSRCVKNIGATLLSMP